MSYIRQVSPYSTNQGNEKICWAHSIARLISRLIKIHFGERQKASDEFMFDEGEILDEYYDTINCSSQHTIFHCIAHAQDVYERKGKLFSIHKSLNKMINWESENLSALLFHFILNSIKNKYGCAGLKYSNCAPIFYFLKLIHEHITEEKIKDILNYTNFQMPPFPLPQLSHVSSLPPPKKKGIYFDAHDFHDVISQLQGDMEMDDVSRDLPYGWRAHMSRTKNLPYWINTLTGKKTWKDPRGVVHPLSPVSSISLSLAPEQSTLGRIAVVGGGLMEPTFRQIQENKVMFLRLITKLASLFEILRVSLEKKTLKINLFWVHDINDFFQINDKGEDQSEGLALRRILLPSFNRRMWFKRIIQVLEQGLYVLLVIYKHAILITAIEGKFFIVKNSWGSDRDWILPDGFHFIVDNKLSISTLIKQSKTTEIELVFIEFETPKYEIFTKKKLPNKSIIHTFKKTAKRLSGYFGMGRKFKTQKNFKKCHKKSSKNDKKY